MYSFLEVKLQRLRRKTYGTNIIRDKKSTYCLQSVLITYSWAWRHNYNASKHNVLEKVRILTLESKYL